ncbi:hypothetical protein [Sinanaerobacter sp. ZZT-01]|uniref:hypothetical protein n=1 Tax=Sinanaerobacter sp. ZZT-01 TaxID=3111540 RepID=UPI002D79BE96|nr:hypothetical protein [Sinanaerobacter sp. ZZT-01]WRR92673.1 hypothetical protein U5921_11550 [Sinanaerobacter sp. ZZT-01]
MKSEDFLYSKLQEVCKDKYSAADIETVCSFLIATQNEGELIKLVDIIKQSSVEEQQELIHECVRLFSLTYIKTVEVLSIKDKRFILPKTNTGKFTQKHKDILYDLVEHETLENPVYLSITDTGILIVG